MSEQKKRVSTIRMNNQMMETLTTTMKQLMAESMTTLNQRLEKIGARLPPVQRRESDQSTWGRRPRPPDHLVGFKFKLPTFHGKNDPEAYLEWEKKMESVFDRQQYTESHKVKVATTEFRDYAHSWWDQFVTTRRRNREYPVESWPELKTVMRKRYAINRYYQEIQERRSDSRPNQGVSVADAGTSYQTEIKHPTPMLESKPITFNQTDQLQNRLEKPKGYDDWEKKMFKAFKAMEESQRKSSMQRPSSDVDSLSQAKSKYDSDLRTNLFQEGGNDVILRRAKQPDGQVEVLTVKGSEGHMDGCTEGRTNVPKGDLTIIQDSQMNDDLTPVKVAMDVREKLVGPMTRARTKMLIDILDPALPALDPDPDPDPVHKQLRPRPPPQPPDDRI